MKKYFVSLLLIISVVAQKEGYGRDKEDYENPDNRGFIERPCPEYDRFCIKGFFAKHSYCKIATGPIDDPYYVTELEIYLSLINATATVTEADVTGLQKGRIQDFYINKYTDNLVIVLYFDSITIDGAQTYFRFFRNGKEPKQLNDFTIIDYKKLTVTIVIPNYLNLRLDRAEITASTEDPLTFFIIGPNVTANPDPDVQSSIRALLADVPTAVFENFLTVAPLLGKIYVQRSICDFGIPVNKIGIY